MSVCLASPKGTADDLHPDSLLDGFGTWKTRRRTETVFGSARNLLLKMIDSPGSVAKPLARPAGSLALGTFHCAVKLHADTFVVRNTARREE